jgi:cell division protein FtsZ
MTINLKAPELRELKPRLMVFGVGGAGCNAVNNMIVSGLTGVDFIVANTDAQALTDSRADRIIQMGLQVTEGLGAGAQPEVGRAAAEETIDEIRDYLAGAHMCFVTGGMGGGTGTGAAPVVARIAREMGILTVGVVTKPFQFEGLRRMRVAEAGILELTQHVDTLIVIPNQNLFRVANERTTFADAFAMADQVLHSGVASITDLMVKKGLVNLDFADVRSVMRDMGKAMMGTGEASGDKRAIQAAEAAIANPLLDEVSMKGARGLLISITGGNDMTLYEVDEAASRIRQEVDDEANIILGATFDQSLEGVIRVSVVATGIEKVVTASSSDTAENRVAEAAQRLRAQAVAQGRPPVISTASAPAPVQAAAAPQPLPLVAAAPKPQPVMQQAPSPHDVHIQPVVQRPVQYAEPQAEPRRAEYQQPSGSFIPPAAEQPVRATRMPTVEELPLPVQNQIRAQRGMAPQNSSHVEAKRRSLLDRLAAFGKGRQEERTAEPQRRPVAAEPQQARQAYPADAHSEYAKRPVSAPQARPQQAQLDAHGRITPAQQRAYEDEQLEIPAFLRRQAN